MSSYRQQHKQIQAITDRIQSAITSGPLAARLSPDGDGHAGVSAKACEVRAMLLHLGELVDEHLQHEDADLYPALTASDNPAIRHTARAFQEEMGDLSAVIAAYCEKWTDDDTIEAAPGEFIRTTTAVFARLFQRIALEEAALYTLVDLAPTDSYRRQHLVILAITDRMQTALAGGRLAATSGAAEPVAGATEMRLLLAELAEAITKHLQDEDERLYPALMASSDQTVRDTAEAFQDEMGDLASVFSAYVERWLADLAIEVATEEFTRETAAVFAALVQRVALEEAELYPLLNAAQLGQPAPAQLR